MSTSDVMIDMLKSDFADVYSIDRISLPLTDGEYMRLIELHFLLKNIRELTDMEILRSFARADNVRSKAADKPDEAGATTTSALGNKDAKKKSTSASAAVSASLDGNKSSSFGENSDTADSVLIHRNSLDIKHLHHRRGQLDRLLADIKAFIAKRLLITERPPRILQLCSRFQFSEAEKNILHLMVVVQGSTNPHVLNTLIEEDYLRRITGFQRLSEMSEVGIELFCDAERTHIKEGIVMVDEENGTHFNLRTPRTVVLLLYGRPVKADDLLKIAQTTLEDILRAEGVGLDGDFTTTGIGGGIEGTARKKKRKGSGTGHRKTKKLASDASDPNDDVVPGPVALVKSRSLNSTSSSPRGLARTSSGSPRRSNSNNSGNTSSGRGSSSRASGTGGGAVEGGGKVNSSLGAKHWASALNSVGGGQGLEALLGMIAGTGGSGDEEDGDEDMVSDYDDSDEEEEEGGYSDMDDQDVGGEKQQGEGTVGNGDDEERVARTGKLATDPNASIVDDEPRPYPADNQLEYLEECFQIVALMVRGNAARIKDDMKKEGTKMSHYYDMGDVKHGRRELQAKLKLHESRVSRRVAATKAIGQEPPRLEVIAERLGLDPFEKKMILLLIGKTVSPVVKTLMDTLDGSNRVADDVVTVGQALAILCQDFQLQVANRKYFYRSGKLMTHGIISLSRSRWHQGSGDLTDNRIILDRRVLDWAVGLDSEINELVEGSDLYEPKVNLSQVVLPPGHLDALLSQCVCYDAFRKYRTSQGLEDVLSYGNSLVIMLCGKSGTGKTMTVNAIARELGKKVLLVDFGSLTGRRAESGSDMDADLRGLFREAQMSNAVLFFDECEVVFRTRNQGGDRMLNSLLTEIERHEGIVFLATNRPYELDEAMHRRITCVLEYRPPDHVMRRAIWENLLGFNSQGSGNEIANNSAEDTMKNDDDALQSQSHAIPHKAKLSLAPDVDVAGLSVKYELTGGFIKNAVLSALLSAIARDKTSPCIQQDDLIAGCKLQMRGSLNQRSFEDQKIVPTVGMDDIDLSPSLRDAAATIIRFEKARARVYGSWSAVSSSLIGGTSSSSSSLLMKQSNALTAGNSTQRACICALAGPVGSGKKTFLKALAYDLGRSLKMCNVADIMTGSIADTVASVQLMLQDARLADSIVAIDGFEHVMDESTAGGGESGWRLHMLLSRLLGVLHTFPGCVVLLCHMDSPQNITLQRDFATQLFCFLRFLTPPPDVRAKLWERLMPARAPISKDVSYIELGRRFELNPGSIRAAVARASAEAAMRDINPAATAATKEMGAVIHQKDLLRAGDEEVAKLRGGNFDLVSKLFT